MTTTVVILVGSIGSGKTTLFGERAKENDTVRPLYPQVANLPIELPSVHYEEDVLKFLAMKLIKSDLTQMEVYVDEAAQAGLESRGSGLKSTDSRLITLARKANVNLWLASQLMSMFDKRAQWNGDYYILCQSHYVTVEMIRQFMPDYFSYEVYDADYKFQKTFYLTIGDAEREIFPLFDTLHVPLRSLLVQEFKQYYWGTGRKGEYDLEGFKKSEEEFDAYIQSIKERQSARV